MMPACVTDWLSMAPDYEHSLRSLSRNSGSFELPDLAETIVKGITRSLNFLTTMSDDGLREKA